MNAGAAGIDPIRWLPERLPCPLVVTIGRAAGFWE